ncbi:MAG: zinc protease [Candidatus Hydrogenedentes bacterium]|nr:zinc protease [Candidatus Hydrogenedentota bacterium]
MFSRKHGVLTGLFVLVAFLAYAGDPGSFDYQEITLDNGLRVITLEDFSCPIAAVHLWYHVGSKDDNPERQGFAHMFEHMMFRGTDRLGPTDHFDYIRQVGGDCNAYTSLDQTVYIQTLPANQIELALWLEAERMSFLKVDQESFDTERKVVEEESRLYRSQPYGTLIDEIPAAIFKQHPYRWFPLGQIPHLRAAAVKELREFWTVHYIPNNATLVIVGAVEHTRAQELAKQYFGWIPSYPEPTRVTIREPMPEEARTVTFAPKVAPAPGVGIIYRTVPLASDDHIPIELMTTILGGGDSSRIYRSLVAEKQLAVVAQGMGMSLEQDGGLGIGALLPPFGGKPDEALAALQAEVERMRTEPVSERELTKAKNQMLRNLVTENLYVVSKASALGSAAVLEGDTARVNRRLDAVRAVTADDLLRVAKTYLDPNRALNVKVERNLLGALTQKPEEDPPVSAEPEKEAPPPGRPGLTRPDSFPAKPPIVGLLDFDPTVKFETATLENGLKVIVVPNRELPFVTAWLGLEAGAWTESKPGTASMALGMLTKGTKKHTEAELADELDTYAIGLSGNGGMDDATVTAGCLTEQLDKAVGLMAEVVLEPLFDAGEFEKLRKQIRTGLAVSSAEPSYITDREYRRRLYGAHPYARNVSGELADVDALTPDDLSAWWKTFARPDMARLIFAGDIDLERAVELAKTALGAWKAEGGKPEVALSPIPAVDATRIYLIDKPGDQTQLRVGQLGITRENPAYFTARVVSSYFGGAFNSRLNESIRVKKGLTYGAGGGYSAQRYAGEFIASTFTKNASAAEAVQAILDEIKRLQSDAPNADELDNTKSYVLGSFAADRETPQQVAGDLWFIESQGLPQDYFERMLKQVSGTTAEQCAQLAQTTLNPDKLVIVVLGPAAELKEALEKIAPVTVVTPEGAEVKAETANPA